MIRIGTCSWKYDSWKGIIYPNDPEINYLKEYARVYNTVEVDQWFWSLFEKEVVLPQSSVVESYKHSVPEDFLFTIKIPNSISLTHYYSRNKNQPLIRNPYFLSPDLFHAFLDSIKRLDGNIGSLILQFEYLNKEKMGSLSEMQDKLAKFFEEVIEFAPPISVEIRNPGFLNEKYFSFLASYGIPNVFLEGYFMPPIIPIINKFRKFIKAPFIIRLHGPDRSGIEKLSGKEWNRIIVNRDEELNELIKMLKVLSVSEKDIYLNVNNHYEGCAPLTIAKIQKLL